MNDKVNDLLKRIATIPSANALAIELRDVLRNDCVVIDKKWLEENIYSVKTWNREDGIVEETYEFRIRTTINAGTQDVSNDIKCERYKLACEKMIDFLEKSKSEEK